MSAAYKYRVNSHNYNKNVTKDKKREAQLSVLYNHYWEKRASLTPAALEALRNAIAKLGGNL